MEVLTLQLGSFSNHVGTHFWNFQDEIAAAEADMAADDGHPYMDFRRLLRQTERGGAVSWHPRLVCVDKKGALGALRRSESDHTCDAGALAAEGLWDFGTTDHCSELVPLHLFQQDLEREAMCSQTGPTAMDQDDRTDPNDTEMNSPMAIRSAAEYNFGNTTRTWTDYLKVQLPSSSVRELQCCHHGVTPFATFFDGRDIRGRSDEEDTIDLVRRQFELCDQLDAVHAIYDMHDGFSGFTDLVLHWVHEEQPKCGKLVLATQPDFIDCQSQSSEITGFDAVPDPMEASPSVVAKGIDSCSWVSAAFSFASLLNVGMDVWIPTAVPLWSVNAPAALTNLHHDSFYETSALIATALETATMPYRIFQGLRPSQFLGALAPSHRPACGLRLALPLPGPAFSISSAQTLKQLDRSFFDLAATPSQPLNPYTSLVLRGADPRRLVALCEELPLQARRFSFTHPAPLPLPVPFPQLFRQMVSCRGLLQESASTVRQPGAEVEECPTATHLHAAAHAGRCEPLRNMVRTVRASRRSAWAATVQARHGVDVDEFQEVIDCITDHLECGAAGSDDEADGADSC